MSITLTKEQLEQIVNDAVNKAMAKYKNSRISTYLPLQEENQKRPQTASERILADKRLGEIWEAHHEKWEQSRNFHHDYLQRIAYGQSINPTDRVRFWTGDY